MEDNNTVNERKHTYDFVNKTEDEKDQSDVIYLEKIKQLMQEQENKSNNQL